jgi:cellulose synthase/poly-beta-1,6-N-acetylglucosamine synthase-like glycosyltransferase
MTFLSIVIPCFDEEACLDELHRRVSAVARAVAGDDHEIVLIDDGSRDGTWAAMTRIAAADPQVMAINLSRNHGHQLALTAGLDLARGDRILILDADYRTRLNCCPKCLPKWKPSAPMSSMRCVASVWGKALPSGRPQRSSIGYSIN